METVLITGVAGGQGRLLAGALRGRYAVCGADRVPWDRPPSDLRFFRVDLRKRKIEDVLRRQRPAVVVHLGFVRHFRTSPRLRHDVNVRGTRRLLDLCVRYGVQRLVVISSGYVYGAFPENPYYVDEDYPLSASRTYPEIRDLVEVDTLVSAFLWQHPEIRTSVLRPVNVLGPTVHSTISEYLRQRPVVTMMGFDPMMQFIHERDFTEAIALAVERGLRGVFNVTGSGAVPLHCAIRETGGRPLPLPDFLARPVFRRLFRLGLWPYPPGALDYLKYPVTLSGKRFADATGFRCRYDLDEVFASFRQERDEVALPRDAGFARRYPPSWPESGVSRAPGESP